MRRLNLGLALLLLAAPPAHAADHADGPAASADPSADIADLYVWTSADASKLNLAMTLGRNVSATSRFSNAVQYVFHTTSAASFGATGLDTDIICEFRSGQTISCWVGAEDYVSGDASRLTGLASKSGKVRVFAGVRDDPFFFNLQGFRQTTSAVTAAAPSLSFDPAGCPALDAATSAALVGLLRTGTGGAAPVDDFAGQNVLAIVVQVDKTLLTKGGPSVAAWSATYRR